MTKENQDRRRDHKWHWMMKENPGRIFDRIQMIRPMIKKLIQDSDKSFSEEENTDWKLISENKNYHE